MSFDKITRWAPDTCGCVVDFHWDRDVPADDRVHTCVAVVPCEHHRGLPHGVGVAFRADREWTKESHTVWHAIHEENHRKNLAEHHAREHLSDTHLIPDPRSVEADPPAVWRPDRPFTWHFDDGRVLHVTLDALAPHQSAALAETWAGVFGDAVRLHGGA